MPSSTSNVNVSQSFGKSDPSLLDSSRPFADSGVTPAGFASGSKQYHPSKGYGGGADFMDDEEGPSAYAFSAPENGPYARGKRSRWTRIREDYLTDVDWTLGINKLLGRRSKFDGVPRDIALNDPEANRVKGFEGNAVSTGKYGPITFLPKFLFCASFITDKTHFQPNSHAVQICSFSLRLASSRSPMSPRLGGTRPSSHLPLSS